MKHGVYSSTHTTRTQASNLYSTSTIDSDYCGADVNTSAVLCLPKTLHVNPGRMDI